MHRWRLVCAAALAALLAAAPAGAQEGEPPPEASAPEPDLSVPPAVAPPPDIEAIEVTGERMNDANVQDQAQAISAFSAEDLDRANIVSVDSLQFNVPGLHVGQSASTPIITLRGIGTENSSLTGEPGVAFHVDGINLSRPGAARVAFFDLETLEVKRGPQGLLSGKNSTSGHINLVTRKPTDEFEVTGDVLFGNYDRVRLRAAVNVPILEGTAARLAFYQENRDGYLDNLRVSDSHDPFDADDLGLRAHLKVTPAERLELLFSYNYFQQDGSGPQSDAVPVSQRHECPVISGMINAQTGLLMTGSKLVRNSVLPFGAACNTLPGIPSGRIISVRPFIQEFLNPLTGQPIIGKDARGNTVYGQYVFDPATEEGDPREIYADTLSSQQNRYWGWTTTADWDVPELPALGETHLKLLGGFQRTEQVFTQDFDATDRPISGYGLDPDTADQYSGELQWSGAAFAERLEWQSSLFHLHEKAKRDVDAPGLVPGRPSGLNSLQTTNNKSYGAALHGGLQLTDALRYSLGARYIKDRKSTKLLRENLAVTTDQRFRGCTGDLGIKGQFEPVYPNKTCSRIYRGMMWGTGFEWRPFGDDHLLYANMNRGYKSGGFRAGAVGEYTPEKIWAYALGTKSEFFDQRLRLNLEGFFYNYQDLQLVILDGLALRTENTDAKMYGWDLEANASPIEGLTLTAVVSFLKTRTVDYYSLDPTFEPPDPSINRAAYEGWHIKRLSEREEAEALEAAGQIGPQTRYATRTCWLSPGSQVPIDCGRLNENPETGPFGDFIRQSAGGLDDYSDKDLSRAPRWKMTFSGGYEIPLGRFGSLTPHVQYTWTDKTYFRAFNRSFDLQEAYHLTDAKLIWNSPENVWSVEAFVQNIEDEAAKLNLLVGPRDYGAPPYAWYNPPRFYGVQVGFRY